MNAEARARADALNSAGLQAEEAGDVEAAEALYGDAAVADPVWSVPWFNLGLVYKRSRRWAESRRANLRATELDPEDEAGWWNLGIAATATRDWDAARRAWSHFGITMPEGEGPFDLGLGLVPIRLDPEGDAEVVWCRRLDPAQAVIVNIPLPGSGHRWGDRLLHDGEPRGTRMLGDQEVPVFDALEVLERSAHVTLSVTIEAEAPEDLEGLEALFDHPDRALEDWSRNIRMLCQSCSEGRPHDEHDPPPPETEGDGVRRRLGVAVRGKVEAEELLAGWAAAGAGRSFRIDAP